MMLLVIDGNNMAHRARYAFSLSYKGEDVSVLYGFLRMLCADINKFKPDAVIVCWDGGIPEYRRKMLPEYKATRHKDDDPLEYESFLKQIQELGDYVMRMMGIVSVRLLGAEADDLMYHASRLAEDEVIISTTDKDLIQAVNSQVSVYSPTKDIMYNEHKILEEFGVTVGQYLDWKAIQGDSSDNIPGVPGIGEKTATKLFQQYRSLTGITNAALGNNPEGKMTANMSERIKSFGLDRIAKNVYVMALYADRTGARSVILDAVYSWIPFNKTRLKRYFMSKAFVSLVDGVIFSNLKELNMPSMNTKNIRIPLLSMKRMPV